MSKWVEFTSLGRKPNRKTVTMKVSNKQSGALLGCIMWYRNWRQYTFVPEALTVFNAECMDDISEKVKHMNEVQKNINKNHGILE